jgi:hypothetical protein
MQAQEAHVQQQHVQPTLKAQQKPHMTPPMVHHARPTHMIPLPAVKKYEHPQHMQPVPEPQFHPQLLPSAHTQRMQKQPMHVQPMQAQEIHVQPNHVQSTVKPQHSPDVVPPMVHNAHPTQKQPMQAQETHVQQQHVQSTVKPHQKPDMVSPMVHHARPTQTQPMGVDPVEPLEIHVEPMHRQPITQGEEKLPHMTPAMVHNAHLTPKQPMQAQETHVQQQHVQSTVKPHQKPHMTPPMVHHARPTHMIPLPAVQKYEHPQHMQPVPEPQFHPQLLPSAHTQQELNHPEQPDSQPKSSKLPKPFWQTQQSQIQSARAQKKRAHDLIEFCKENPKSCRKDKETGRLQLIQGAPPPGVAEAKLRGEGWSVRE